MSFQCGSSGNSAREQCFFTLGTLAAHLKKEKQPIQLLSFFRGGFLRLTELCSKKCSYLVHSLLVVHSRFIVRNRRGHPRLRCAGGFARLVLSSFAAACGSFQPFGWFFSGVLPCLRQVHFLASSASPGGSFLFEREDGGTTAASLPTKSARAFSSLARAGTSTAMC